MARGNKRKLCALVTAISWVFTAAVKAEVPSLSQQLLSTYYGTAGVCTTSAIDDIRDSGDIVTVAITIEPNTRKELQGVLDHEKDNWFSLHCPPEVHGVWRQPTPPSDILVTGMIVDDDPYTMSCVDYQTSQQWGVRRVTIRDKIQQWLTEKLP